MRKISEILYKKFRPAVFIKWGLGRNSTSSALTRLAWKTYLAYKKDFSWPAPESLIRIRTLSLSLTSIWCEIYVQGNCVKIYVFSYLTWSELVRGKCSQEKFMPGGEQIGLEHLAISSILWSPCFFPSFWCKYDHLT